MSVPQSDEAAPGSTGDAEKALDTEGLCYRAQDTQLKYGFKDRGRAGHSSSIWVGRGEWYRALGI
eukprot:110458-Rhodomonas_salina.1